MTRSKPDGIEVAEVVADDSKLPPTSVKIRRGIGMVEPNGPPTRISAATLLTS